MNSLGRGFFLRGTGTLSNRQIAAQLCVTEATVKRHPRNIFVKLGAVSRSDAVNKAGRPRTTRTPPAATCRAAACGPPPPRRDDRHLVTA